MKSPPIFRLAVCGFFLFPCFSLGLGAEAPYPRVFRTFMPESGPSAFAVELSPDLALCYDPLRGGVNGIWAGTIDLSPTFQAKINNPANPVGPLVYAETLRQPLRLGDPSSLPAARFKGYRYEDGAVTFEISLDGFVAAETFRLTSDGKGIIREILLPKDGGEGFFLLEPQSGSQVTVTGGREEKPGQWRFPEGGRISLVITPNKHDQP